MGCFCEWSLDGVVPAKMHVTPHMTHGFADGCLGGIFSPSDFFDGLPFSGKCSGKFTISAKAGSDTVSLFVRNFVSIEAQMGMHFFCSLPLLTDMSSSPPSPSSSSVLTLVSDLISRVSAAEANLSMRSGVNSCLTAPGSVSLLGAVSTATSPNGVTDLCCRG